MKRMMSFLLVLSLLLTLCACGGKEPPVPTEPGVTVAPADEAAENPEETAGSMEAASQETADPTETAPTEPVDGTEAPTEIPAEATDPQETEAPGETATEAPAAAVSGQELVNDGNVTFTVTGYADSEHLGLQMQVFCENKTDRTVIFALDGVSVCGIMFDPFWAEEVTGGSAVYSVISFDTYQLEEMGITSVDEISFRLTVIDSENWMDEPLTDGCFTVYPTGLNADTVVYPEYRHKNGETVLLDNRDVLFIVEKADDAGDDLYTLHCFIENRTDKDLLLAWEGVSVNSMMVDPFWAAFVGAGKQMYTTVSFFRSDLEAQGIEDVRDIRFTLTAFDYNDFTGDYIVEEELTFQPK